MVDVSYDHYPLAATSFIISLIGYYFISPRLSEKYVAGYSELSDSVKIFWNTLTTSNVHVAIICPLALYVMLTDEAINNDFAWGRSFMAHAPIAITLGYISSDFCVMLHKFTLKESKSYLVHHILTMLPYWCNITFGPLTYFAVFRLIGEASTPFVNQRYFLDVLNKKGSRAYMINGILMTIAFFFARIAVLPPYYYGIYLALNSDAVNTIHWILLSIWIGGSIGLDILNVLWFKKMCRGALKFLIVTDKSAIEASGDGNGDAVRTRVKGE